MLAQKKQAFIQICADRGNSGGGIADPMGTYRRLFAGFRQRYGGGLVHRRPAKATYHRINPISGTSPIPLQWTGRNTPATKQ